VFRKHNIVKSFFVYEVLYCEEDYCLGYDFNTSDPSKYPVWVLERECQKILGAVVFIRSFTGSISYVPTHTFWACSGNRDLSYVNSRLFFRAMVGSQMASLLEKVNACEQLLNM